MKKVCLKTISTVLAFALVIQFCLSCMTTIEVSAVTIKNEVSTSKNVKVTYLGLKSGDATLISYTNECNSNKTEYVLIDCGGSGAEVAVQLHKLGITNLQAVILTHQHVDHVQGLQYLPYFTYTVTENVNGKSVSKTVTGSITVERLYFNNIFGPETIKVKENNKEVTKPAPIRYSESYNKTRYSKEDMEDATYKYRQVSTIKTNVASLDKPIYVSKTDTDLVSFKDFANLTSHLKKSSGKVKIYNSKTGHYYFNDSVNSTPTAYMYTPDTSKKTNREVLQVLKHSSNSKLSDKVEFYLYVSSNYWEVTGVTPKNLEQRHSNDSSMMVQVVNKNEQVMVNNKLTPAYKYLFGGDIHVESMYDWMQWFNANSSEMSNFVSQEYKIAHHGRRANSYDLTTDRIAAQPSTVKKYSGKLYNAFQADTLNKGKDKFSVERSFVKYYVMGYNKSAEKFPFGDKYKLISSSHSTLFTDSDKEKYEAPTKLLENYLSVTLKRNLVYLKN